MKSKIHFITTYFLAPFHDSIFLTKAPSPGSQIPALFPARKGITLSSARWHPKPAGPALAGTELLSARFRLGSEGAKMQRENEKSKEKTDSMDFAADRPFGISSSFGSPHPPFVLPAHPPHHCPMLLPSCHGSSSPCCLCAGLDYPCTPQQADPAGGSRICCSPAPSDRLH